MFIPRFALNILFLYKRTVRSLFEAPFLGSNKEELFRRMKTLVPIKWFINLYKEQSDKDSILCLISKVINFKHWPYFDHMNQPNLDVDNFTVKIFINRNNPKSRCDQNGGFDTLRYTN